MDSRVTLSMQIYLIANTVTGQNYVGQTRWDFNTRYKAGNWIGTTHSKYLRSAGKKYGVDSFKVTILREGEFTPDELNALEDFYMKEYNSLWPNGYNWMEAGRKGRRYHNQKEYELKDANETVYHVVNLRQFCKKTGLAYGGMLNMVSGLVRSSQGYALSSTPTEQIIDPNETWKVERVSTGEVFEVKRREIGACAEKLSIPRAELSSLVRGEVLCCKGLKLEGAVLNPNLIAGKRVKYERVELVHEDGREVIVDSLYRFAKEQGIHRNEMYRLASGKALQRAGWRLKSMKDPRQENINRRGLSLNLKNVKSGEVIAVKNVSEFCRVNGFNVNVMHGMIGGAIQQYMGWTLPDRDMSSYKPPKKIVYLKMRHEGGQEVEGVNPGDVVRRFGVSNSQSIGDIIRGKTKNRTKGWSVVHVRFSNDHYPEIRLEPPSTDQ